MWWSAAVLCDTEMLRLGKLRNSWETCPAWGTQRLSTWMPSSDSYYELHVIYCRACCVQLINIIGILISARPTLPTRRKLPIAHVKQRRNEPTAWRQRIMPTWWGTHLDVAQDSGRYTCMYNVNWLQLRLPYTCRALCHSCLFIASKRVLSSI